MVPGVITRTTWRGTIPFTLVGSAICSQMATFCPWARSSAM